MQSKFSRKPVITVMLALVFFLVSLVFHNIYMETRQKSPLVATKYYTHSFYASIIIEGDAEDVAVRGSKKRYIRRVVLAKSSDSENLHDSAGDDVVFVDGKEGIKTVCIYQAPEDATYSAELIDVVVSSPIAPGDEFEVEITMLNTGDAAWFSRGSECTNQVEVNLGTALDRDRSSLFGSDRYAVEGWFQSNRVEMVEERVDPEETATFRFVSDSSWGDTWYKEYFMPVVENVGWMEDALAEVNILIGDAENVVDAGIMQFIDWTADSKDFLGEKRIEIDLSEQEMHIFVDETQIGMFPVSTGAYDTPTPTGTYYVLNKQELRVGGEWPHYHMPNWMGFTKWGHGLHSLPYLANDGGAFWYEALDHIGIPVSHGCVRMLPEDSEMLFDFGFVDMRIDIYS